MNNEPVAWTDGNGHYFDKNSSFPVDDLIPLYTQKKLTNEEIAIIGNKFDLNYLAGQIDFARAILKKAQEK